MFSCSKRIKRKEKKYKKIKKEKKNVIHPFTDSIFCSYCKKHFNSNEIKAHCNICNNFFHCGVAGECIGEDCKIVKPNGEIHRARYCVNCVSKIYKNNQCICKDCSK